jgi:hypothetical protein
MDVIFTIGCSWTAACQWLHLYQFANSRKVNILQLATFFISLANKYYCFPPPPSLCSTLWCDWLSSEEKDTEFRGLLLHFSETEG